MSYRAGDVVYHAGTEENWTLAVDEFDGRVMPAGWPCTLASANECTLICAATDEQRILILKQAAEITGSDMRGSKARQQLAALAQRGGM